MKSVINQANLPVLSGRMSDIGRAIRQARRNQRLTIRELAEAVDIDETTVSRIELGKVKNPQKADLLQRHLKIGIYAEARSVGDSRDDPRLSEATFEELMAAANLRHAQDLRAARESRGTRLTAIDELPPDVARRALSGDIPSDLNGPNEGNSTG